jgi:hypothetical protein
MPTVQKNFFQELFCKKMLFMTYRNLYFEFLSFVSISVSLQIKRFYAIIYLTALDKQQIYLISPQINMFVKFHGSDSYSRS